MSSCEIVEAVVEVSGESVRAMVAGMADLAPFARKLLEKHGLSDPQPGQWYPQRAWLDASWEIAATLGPNTLFRIGCKLIDHALIPSGIHSFEQALAAIDVAYQMNHRGGDIGSYAFVSTGPRAGRVICRNPNPSDFDRGIIQSVARRFLSEGDRFSIHLDYKSPSRKSGGDSCTFLVSW